MHVTMKRNEVHRGVLEVGSGMLHCDSERFKPHIPLLISQPMLQKLPRDPTIAIHNGVVG